jgi:hypothetical protein
MKHMVSHSQNNDPIINVWNVTQEHKWKHIKEWNLFKKKQKWISFTNVSHVLMNLSPLTTSLRVKTDIRYASNAYLLVSRHLSGNKNSLVATSSGVDSRTTRNTFNGLTFRRNCWKHIVKSRFGNGSMDSQISSTARMKRVITYSWIRFRLDATDVR